MPPNPYIVGYDGSEPSRKAVEYATAEASSHGRGIVLVHVIDWSPFEFHTLEENEHQAAERREQIEQDRRELFPPLLASLAAAGVAAESSIQYGHPAEVLARLAKEHDANSIVVGRTGRSQLKALLFGGVASRVILLSDRPVIVVP